MDNPNSGRPRDAPAYDYCKYHGLGNDYLVVEPGAFREFPTAAQVRALCDRHRGPGADGVLVGPLPQGAAVPPAVPPGVLALRIFNPDGSEAERSGNGLRIFARHVWEQGLVATSPFSLHTPAGTVEARVLEPSGGRIAVQMGSVSFRSERIPMTGAPREVLREPLRAGELDFTVCAANVGNPHCVVLSEAPTPELAQRVGPLIEHHPSFPQRTNVQFLQRLDAQGIRIEIWERGAGYTQASGTSSCAAAAVAVRLGLCIAPVTVHMPGGTMTVRLDAAYRAELEGNVSAVARGRLAQEFLAQHGIERR